MARLIYDTADLTNISNQILQKVNRAVVAAAIKVRDDVRQTFVSDAQALYRHHTGDIAHLTTGIMIGKDNGGSIKIHALGSREIYDSYKTRFFIGGTKYRTQEKVNGRNIRPFTKGYIAPTDTLGRVVNNSGATLSNYINRALQNG